MIDLEQYSRYFAAGMKVGVGIPVANAEVFRDWAIIHELDEDLVSLQLSRDQLPVNVSLHVGQILEVRGGREGAGFSCRAIIVSEGEAHEILLRLIGEIVSDELREFYRIDAFLPIKYYISREQRPELLQKEWEERRAQRQIHDLNRTRKRWDSTVVGKGGELPQEPREEADTDEDDVDHDESWNTIIPLAANISGGGIRMITHQGFEHGDYVLLEILVPSPRHIVDVVARVIFANRNNAADSDREYFNTGMQFIYIDERDRDIIINHISNVQLKRIRQLREKYLFRAGEETAERAEESVPFDWQRLAQRAVLTLFLLVVFGLLFNYFRHYASERPKNEIEEVFESGIKKYLEKFK